MQFLLAHAPYIHTCPTKHSHANPKIDFRWPWLHHDCMADAWLGLPAAALRSARP
jgi:hypothetical protein